MTDDQAKESLTVAEVSSLGGWGPTQGEGTLSDGRHWYLKIRHSTARLWVGDVPFGQDSFSEDGTWKGRWIGVEVVGLPDDPHVWSYMPEQFRRPILDLLVWTLGDSESRPGR